MRAWNKTLTHGLRWLPIPAYLIGVLHAAPAPFMLKTTHFFLCLFCLLSAIVYFFKQGHWLSGLLFASFAFLAGHQWASSRFIKALKNLPPEEELGQSLKIQARVRQQWATGQSLAVSLDSIKILSPAETHYRLSRLTVYLPQPVQKVRHRSEIITWVKLRRRPSPHTFEWPMLVWWERYRPSFYGSVKSRLLIQAIETLPPPNTTLSQGNRQLQALFLLGQSSSLWRDRLQPFGLGHLLAISGLHCLWVYLLIQLVLFPLRQPIWRTLLTCMGLLMFAHHMGWSASVSRATVMLILWQCLPALNRRRERCRCWAFLLITSAILNPLQLLSQGYWYTFAASLGIILAAKPIADSPLVHPLRRTIQPILPILGAQLMVIPIQLIFGIHAPLASVFWNLLGSVVLLIMMLLFGLGLLAQAGAFPASLVNGLENHFGNGLNLLAQSLPNFELVRFPHSPVTVCAVLAASALVLHFGQREWRWYWALLILTIFGLCQRPLSGQRTVMLDVGQGASILHIDRNHQAWLFDAGGRLPRYIHFSRLIRLFGGKTVAAAFISHFNRDHFQLLEQLEGTYPIYLPEGQATLFQKHRGLRRRHSQIALASGTYLAAGELDAEILLPQRRISAPNTNEGSLVILLRGPWGSLLFTGDAGLWAEARLAEVPPTIGPRWLQVGHHGSRSATGMTLLRNFQPDTALISAGRRNPFGHPHPDVVTRLRRMGVSIRNTARSGTIQIGPDP